ncbi:MAG: hypothetical protein GY696_09515, partial [Gammaproteobacteria bacterium]|nr:hypothetical protein [Gammaproteobacteria bacterium]
LLYNEFAHKFPEAIDLWANMVVDELEHQKMVRGLYKYVKEGKLFFNAMILKVSNIESHIRSIEKLIDRAKTEEDFSLKDAVAMAVNIEHSMLDQNFFLFNSAQISSL